MRGERGVQSAQGGSNVSDLLEGTAARSRGAKMVACWRELCFSARMRERGGFRGGEEGEPLCLGGAGIGG